MPTVLSKTNGRIFVTGYKEHKRETIKTTQDMCKIYWTQYIHMEIYMTHDTLEITQIISKGLLMDTIEKYHIYIGKIKSIYNLMTHTYGQ
jgi:hypothetical protein